ncbi:MAG: hypothetical protein HQ518_23850 [Rhodopirellula sp.]|nr:hypothetical protein [Rhodopirellula sp.]
MRPKTRTIAGGLVIVGVVLGSFMSGLLPGFGSGSGVGAQISVSGDATSASKPKSDEEMPSEPAAMEKPAIASVEPAAPPTVLETRVDNHDYLVPDNSDASGVRKVDLDEVVKLAQATTGNDDGIRVRIIRSPSARLTAWITLHDALAKAGLAPDSIRMPKELVE